ncbi:MAG: FAD-dependent oxidoreductase [Chloroflexota bacterium]
MSTGTNGRRRLLICHSSGCANSKSPVLFANLREHLTRVGLADAVTVERTGCHGFCQNGPIVVVEPERVLYTRVKPDDAAAIVDEHIVGGGIVDRLLFKDPATGKCVPHYDEVAFFFKQQRRILARCGRIDPDSLDDYLATGGYSGLRRALRALSAEAVIAEVKQAGLRGRGGGGYPTAFKWALARETESDQKYVVANGYESDPGASVDRSLMEGDPHAVLEGLLLAAYAVGATRAYLYIQQDYKLAVRRLRAALAQAEAAGYVGENILGSAFSCRVSVVEATGSFLAGHEPAIIAWIEGKRAMPRPRPPHPAKQGLWGRPTIVNNVETLANVTLIVAQGAEQFAAVGTPASPGTKLFALTGKVNNVGAVEAPLGTSLRDLIFEIGGGVTGGRPYKGVITGGPTGGMLPASMLDLKAEYDTLTESGSIMGSGGLVVMDETSCAVDMAKFFLSLSHSESCGKCAPCRLGTKQMLDILVDITEGRGKPEDLDRLREIGEAVKLGSLCGLGRTAPNPVLTGLKYFREEYEAHVFDKACPAGGCQKLFVAPCENTCPLHQDVPLYAYYISQGRIEEALAVIRETNPFPSICGRICDHRCEARCRRADVDEAVSVRNLKRFAVDYAGRETEWTPALLEGPKEERVAIVGGGPAGLAAALRLARLGYKVTVFEALPVAGGMMMVGIPEYRLPKAVLNREIEMIKRLGVEIKFNRALGRDFTLEELQRDGYAAVLLATGAHQSAGMRVPGEDLEGVLGAIHFLREDALGLKPKVGKRVAVIGGGSVAMDAARSALRCGAEEVHVFYRRDRADMPAPKEEIEDAEAEGVHVHVLTAPTRVVGHDGKVVGLECQQMALGAYDDSGRRKPVPVAGSEFTVDVDNVIAAIGQVVHSDFLPKGGDWRTRRGSLAANPRSLATPTEGIFAAGDAVTGPWTLVQAVAGGNRAADSIHRYLRGQPLVVVAEGPRRRRFATPPVGTIAEYGRTGMPMLAAEGRARNQEEVELGFDLDLAQREACRCLRCDFRDEEE